MLFSGLLNNDRIKDQLNLMESQGNFPHAIIIDGGTEQERHMLADILASWRICESENERPCGVCLSCQKLASNSHPDVFRVTGTGSSRSLHIDMIRNIRQDAYIIPNEAQYKLYIIENAEMMTEQAQNALLKVLEEPPRSVVFILTCGSSSSLLLTIRSRSQVLTLDSSDEYLEVDEKSKGVAEEIAMAVVSSKELDLLRATAPLIKDKVLIKSVLQALLEIFRRACVSKECEEHVSESELAIQKLSQRLTSMRLLSLINVIIKSNEMLERNVNTNILIADLCVKMRNAAIL